MTDRVLTAFNLATRISQPYVLVPMDYWNGIGPEAKKNWKKPLTTTLHFINVYFVCQIHVYGVWIWLKIDPTDHLVHIVPTSHV